MKVGVVGCGDWGENLVRVFSELDVLDSIFDIDTKRMDTLCYCYKVKAWLSYEEMLKDKAIKAVVIATPVVTHYKMVKEALLADKDVFVEKPLAVNYKEGKELVDLAKSKNRILMVGHILAYHPAVVKLKELIVGGELGKVNYIYSNRLNLGRIRTEENVLLSFASHDILVMLDIVGEEPIRVATHSGTYISKDISDISVLVMNFPSGVRSHIFVSWLHPYKEQKMVVIGSKAMAVFDDMSVEKLFIYPHKVKLKKGKIPVVEEAQYELVPGLQKLLEPLKLECEHFIECVRLRIKPITDGEKVLKVLKVLEGGGN